MDNNGNQKAKDRVEFVERLFLYGVILSVIVLGVVFLYATHVYPQHLVAAQLTIVNMHPKMHPFCGGMLVLANNVQQSGLALRFAVATIGTMIAMVGALMVVKGVQAASYEIKGDHKDSSLAFKTASPGLVMITFGAILMSAAVFKNTQVEFARTDACVTGSAAPNYTE